MTELVYGVDLVAQQLRIAAGESLALRQGELLPRGHAVEARLYAEDPSAGFLPSTGTVRVYREPMQQGVRVAANGDLRLEPTPGQWSPMPAQLRPLRVGAEHAQTTDEDRHLRRGQR